MNQFSRTVLRNSAFGLAAQMAIKVLSFVFSILIIRNLGAEEFGQYTGVLAFGATFVFLSDLGLAPYSVRQIARWRDDPQGEQKTADLYGNLLALRLMLSALTMVVLTLAAWLTRRPPVMIAAVAINSVGLMMYALQGSYEAVLQGRERLDLSSSAKVVNQFAFVALGGLALYLGFGYYGLIAANLIAIALMTYFCWRAIRHIKINPKRMNPAIFVSLIKAALPFGVIGFALGLSYKFDSLLLNIFRSDAETGYYAAAYNLVFSAVMISNVVNTSLYPSLTRHHAGDPQRLPAITEKMLRYLLVLSLPMAVGAWALADQLVPFLYEGGYQPTIRALQIVVWVIPFMYASEFLGYVVLISNRERLVMRAVLVSTGINVLVNFILVPRIGFIAAAVMTVVTEIVLVGQHLWTLRSIVTRIHWGVTLVKPMIAAGLMGAAVLALRPVLPLLANVVVGALIYAALLLVMGVLRRDDLSILRKTPLPEPAPLETK